MEPWPPLPPTSPLPLAQGLCLDLPVSTFHAPQSMKGELLHEVSSSFPSPTYPYLRDFLLVLEIECFYPPLIILISLSIFIKLSLWLQDKVN